MKVLETERLILRWVETSDAEFILKLLNDPGWIQYIGDKGIRTIDDAKDYIVSGPIQMYKNYGFGLFLTELKDNHTPIGLCGLIKRDGLEDVDIGFAFLTDYQGYRYAYEAATGTVKIAKEFGLKRIVAITSQDNCSSTKLLEKIGMKFEGFITLPQDTEELKFYGLNI